MNIYLYLYIIMINDRNIPDKPLKPILMFDHNQQNILIFKYLNQKVSSKVPLLKIS